MSRAYCVSYMTNITFRILVITHTHNKCHKNHTCWNSGVLPSQREKSSCSSKIEGRLEADNGFEKRRHPSLLSSDLIHSWAAIHTWLRLKFWTKSSEPDSICPFTFHFFIFPLNWGQYMFLHLIRLAWRFIWTLRLTFRLDFVQYGTLDGCDLVLIHFPHPEWYNCVGRLFVRLRWGAWSVIGGGRQLTKHPVCNCYLPDNFWQCFDLTFPTLSGIIAPGDWDWDWDRRLRSVISDWRSAPADWNWSQSGSHRCRSAVLIRHLRRKTPSEGDTFGGRHLWWWKCLIEGIEPSWTPTTVTE